jgi:hypothetical protein
VNATSAWTHDARDLRGPEGGGIKCCLVSRGRTALLLHTQKVEIKYRKPTALRARSAVDYGGIASDLNRFESLSENFPRRRRRLEGGGGVKISTGSRARYRSGLMRRFFLAPGALNFFLEIKEIKRGERARTEGEVNLYKALGPDRAVGPHKSPRNSRFVFLADRGQRNARLQSVRLPHQCRQRSSQLRCAGKTSRNSGWGGG